MRLAKSLRHYLGRVLHSNAQPAASNKCQLGEGSSLGPEATIDNIRGTRECISLGQNSCCRGRLLTYGHGGRIGIGDWCYIGINTEIWSMESVEIGDRVLISHGVNIHDGTAHSLDPAERHAHFRHIIEKGHPTDVKDLPGVYSAPVIIEDDVWVSFGVTILRGVRIGAGSVIAANSLVTKDVPPGVIYRNSVTANIQPLPVRGAAIGLSQARE